MKTYIGLLVGIILAFNVLYHFYLSHQVSKNRNLILNEKYLKELFSQENSTNTASQGHNDEISVEIVAFEPEDFKSEIGKVNWTYLEERLGDRKNQK